MVISIDPHLSEELSYELWSVHSDGCVVALDSCRPYLNHQYSNPFKRSSCSLCYRGHERGMAFPASLLGTTKVTLCQEGEKGDKIWKTINM